MPDESFDSSTDLALQGFKEARDVAATLKAELLNFRSSNPNAIIFAFEGKDDKIVYSHWIRQFSITFPYKPFPCQNKHRTLKLKESLERDLNGLANNVYFFIDRDFDDLAGVADSSNVFMTDKYSVENYLVTVDVLDQILRNEFHCHGKPECRKKIIELFNAQYDLFLKITEELNFRIFVSKKLSIRRTKEISSKIGVVVKIDLTNIACSDTCLSEIVCLESEPSQSEFEAYRAEFENFNRADRYRGKFCFNFFRKWLELLAHERNSDSSLLFPDLDREHLKAPTNINLDSFASKATPPTGLTEFLQSIAESKQLKFG